MWHALIDVICNTRLHPSSLCSMKEKRHPQILIPPALWRLSLQQHKDAASSRAGVTLPHGCGSCIHFLHKGHLRGVPAALPHINLLCSRCQTTAPHSHVARTAANCCLFARNSLFSPMISYKTSLDNLKI